MNSMKEALDRWLKSAGLEVDSGLTRATCEKLGISGEAFDACQVFATEFESGGISEEQFLVGLSDLSKKTVEEVEKILKSMAKPIEGVPNVKAQAKPNPSNPGNGGDGKSVSGNRPEP